MKRAVLVLLSLVLVSVGFMSCGYKSSSYQSPSRIHTRVLISQDVNSSFTFGGLKIIDAENDTVPAVAEIQAGATPSFMAVSPDRAILIAFDPASGTVQTISTAKESNTGSIALPGPNAQTPGTTTSMIIPTTTGIGYGADPVAGSPQWSVPGAIVMMNLTTNAITTQIGVPAAQTVVSNANGAQLLVFSEDSDSISIVSPLLAVPPVDQGCDTAPNPVCTVVPGFDRPVSAIFNGNTVYIINCGAECGGKQASLQTLDLATMTAGTAVPVDAATVAFLSGSTLYVAGTSPSNNSCTGQTTAATTCGRLDVVDLSGSSPTVTNSVIIPDGYHDHIDMSLNGQLFVGSRVCTNIGNVNNPSGEVRGCLAIFDTTKPGNTTPIIPPDNGDVTGMQSFTTLYKVYVIEGGKVRVYDSKTDKLEATTSVLIGGTIIFTGQPIDVKAIDFF